MALDQRILEHIRDPNYIPQTIDALGQALEVSKAEEADLKETLRELINQGLIAKVKRNRFVAPKDADLATGEMRFRQGGSAVLIPDEPKMSVLQILAEDTGVALHGDKVLVRLQSEPKWRARRRRRGEPKQAFARVLRILQRKNTTITGTLKHARLCYFVIPDDPRILQDVLVPPPESYALPTQPAVGDKVVIRLHEWKQRHLNPEGEIIEVLGKTHEPFAEFKALLHNFQLSLDFPDAVMQEVKTIGDQVTAKDLENRRDLRNVLTLTIDPDDARDFDDALSIEPLPDGGTRVGIHIADVSHYVKRGSALDKEAHQRGNSTYLVGCVIPMLPHALSNGICSLLEDEDRLTKSVFLDFDAKGGHVDTHFANTVIRSNKRLTYRQAYACMDKHHLDEIRGTPMPSAHQTGATGRALSEVDDSELGQIRDTIRALWTIASRLRKARFKTGSLELDMPEVRIYVDEQGYADRIEAVQHDKSHQLVEEFMLAANEAVARTFFEQGMSTLSRVHEEPIPEKLLELREQMLVAGITVGDLTNRKEVTDMLRKIDNHPQAYPLKIAFLRSMQQACYRAAYDGHYGLAKPFYLHFTSPIRRYADLVVHRQFDWFAARRKLETAPQQSPKAYPPVELAAIGQHLSITERNSQEAERGSVKIKLLEFFEREVARAEKTSFEAIIIEVKNHGMFVELTESLAFGLVHVSTLQDDLYQMTGDGMALVGRRQKKRYYAGQAICVVTERVDRFKRQIDFRISEEETEAKAEAGFFKAVQKVHPIQQAKKQRAPTKKQAGQGSQKASSKAKSSQKTKPNKAAKKARRKR